MKRGSTTSADLRRYGFAVAETPHCTVSSQDIYLQVYLTHARLQLQFLLSPGRHTRRRGIPWAYEHALGATVVYSVREAFQQELIGSHFLDQVTVGPFPCTYSANGKYLAWTAWHSRSDQLCF
jgi:hypothetical protein